MQTSEHLAPGRILLFGGTRGTGLDVARLARARDWDVVALARPQSDTQALSSLGARVVAGDALDPDDVAMVIDAFGRDRQVVSTMGGGPVGASADYQGTAHVVDAMVAAGVRRLVLVSSLGAGDSRAHASERLLAAIGPVLAEKTKGEDHARDADLDLTVIRPGGLVDGPAGEAGQARGQGAGQLYDDPRVHGRIGRADLARLVLACLDDPATIGRTLSAIDPETLSAPDDVRVWRGADQPAA
ncbi:hypothetical protein CCR80_00745 [Rhodothalassium salexigens]|uniref:SDR family oxidoreductase n=1 Tax=Rhodothalassium salexigens TaxID=1086 RepID=UPI001913BEDF|nr:SDR family oxidoreductase [Rhodothalassium salexigens]MBK5919568.1 hypothetical protein [Rhodothalassium salexigens]